MAIGSHGRGRGGTVGDGRLAVGRRVEKLFSFSGAFVRAAVKTDHDFIIVSLYVILAYRFARQHEPNGTGLQKAPAAQPLQPHRSNTDLL